MATQSPDGTPSRHQPVSNTLASTEGAAGSRPHRAEFAPQKTSEGSSLARALHSDDLYAQLVRHWNNYRAGGHARVTTIRGMRQEALMLARSDLRDALPESSGHPMALKPAPL